MISFYLNGKYVEETTLNPNTTVLDYLRLNARQTDTKEGCGSGDCGACTVMAQCLSDGETAPFFTFNSCITLLSLLDGHHIITASYLADNPQNHPDRARLHPAQQAMVECHGSQCGYCTPGFVMSLASVYENRRQNEALNERQNEAPDLSYDDIVASISGNLCRCTGYRPIIEAGLAMMDIGKVQIASQQSTKALGLAIDVMAESNRRQEKSQKNDQNAGNAPKPVLSEGSKKLFAPTSIDELNQILSQYPQATIWAGGTDLGLTITQRLVDHDVIIQLSGIDSLRSWSIDEKGGKRVLTLGAGMTYNAMLPILEDYFPEFAALFERIASPQIRNMGTIGGNIANASPIGDLPPVLLALDAQIQLRYCDGNSNNSGVRDETIPLSEFFLDYKKTKLCAGAYVVGVQIPLMSDREHLFIYKISKRYEDDISACLVAVKLGLSKDNDTIETANIGLGGMAAVPLLAKNSQNLLKGQPLALDSFQAAADALSSDVTPMTDVRASREYRLNVTKRLLIKCGKEILAKNQSALA